MYRIDWKKWRAAVAAAEARKANDPKRPWIDDGVREELTMLYSIRAHGRGRLHRRQAEFNHYEYRRWEPYQKPYVAADDRYPRAKFSEAGGKLTIPLTMEGQARYVGDRWKEFARGESDGAHPEGVEPSPGRLLMPAGRAGAGA